MREEGGGRREEKNLIAFLKSKRWFGDKGREIASARLRDVIPVEWPNSKKTFRVGRAEVQTEQGTSTYQLFSSANDITTDALEDEEFLRGLADVWSKGAAFNSGGTSWIVRSESKTPLVVPPGAPIALSRTEQTNSSVILNREAILKLYRKLEEGTHPDVEVTQFLTLERLFVHVPVLMGTITFEDSSGTTVAGMLQEYVQGATDGWSHVLARLHANEPFDQESEQLGVITRALHETLASGDAGSDFDLRPASPQDVQRWQRAAADTIGSGARALERALDKHELPGRAAKEARVAVERLQAIRHFVEHFGATLGGDAGGNTRTHGDYHLGQVLRSAASQFLIIDFEGEPTRPLQDRRARSSPLRDVAGMLRSFSYAAATASANGWERSVRTAFLRGYFSEQNGQPGLLPRSRDHANQLIALFETEKAFYELQYELDHRPDWVWIPLHGITELSV